jgi:hypothetical protein
MLDLELFYYKKVCIIPPCDRYHALLEIEDVIVINFDCLFDRECAIRGADQLIYQAHKLGVGKRFLFISEDGANLHFSGALNIINNIVKCFGLNKQTCMVICREYISIQNVRVVVDDAVPYWCRVLYPVIKDIPIPQGPFSKKFAAWYNRGTFYRLDIARHLFTNYKEDSFISYQESGVLLDRKLIKYFQPEVEWAVEHAPIIFDQIFPGRVFDHDMIVGKERKQYNDYFIEIVAETDILTTDWLTEKTVKNLYIGKPFIVMSGPKSLDRIRSRGFQTFSPWIDETYDTIENNYLRLEAIKKEIDRLATKSLEELTNMHLNMMPILKHNRQVYENFVSRR